MTQVDGVFQMPYFSMSKEAIEFQEAAYEYGWVIRLEWAAWKETPEAERLRDDPAYLATATPEQLENLLTVCIRQDSFCEGALAGAFDTGLLTGIPRRAAALSEELAINAHSKGQYP